MNIFFYVKKYEILTEESKINCTTITRKNQPCLMPIKKQNYRYIVRCFMEYVL
jgi:hypothetical protein